MAERSAHFHPQKGIASATLLQGVGLNRSLITANDGASGTHFALAAISTTAGTIFCIQSALVALISIPDVPRVTLPRSKKLAPATAQIVANRA
jgi:hypothetical protein